MRAIMIDIETLDTAPTAHILSIGACVVGPKYLREVDTFYEEIDDHQPGRTISPATVRFWKNENLSLPQGSTKLDIALFKLTDFLNFHRTESGDGKLEIWCKGMDFDTTILKNAYEQLNLDLPWKYNEARDYRTLLKHYSNIPQAAFEGNQHNALDDALHQAKHLDRLMSYQKYLLSLAPVQRGESISGGGNASQN